MEYVEPSGFLNTWCDPRTRSNTQPCLRTRRSNSAKRTSLGMETPRGSRSTHRLEASMPTSTRRPNPILWVRFLKSIRCAIHPVKIGPVKPPDYAADDVSSYGRHFVDIE